MPASVAGSAAGGGDAGVRTSAKRRLSASIKTDCVLAGGLTALSASRRQLDEEYCHEQISEATDAVVEHVAMLFRSGSLLRAMQLSEATSLADTIRGELLQPKVRSFKAMFIKELVAIVQRWEPTVFTDQVCQQLGRQDLRKLITFAIGVTDGCALPNHEDALRFVNVLGRYLETFYNRLGRRLRGWSIEGREAFGYLALDRESRTAKVLVPGSAAGLLIPCPILEYAADATLDGNLSLKVRVVSARLAISVPVLLDWNKSADNKVEGDVNELPRLADAEVPVFCMRFFKQHEGTEVVGAGGGDPPAAVAPAAQAAQGGDGEALVPAVNA
eukprot:TRINITY_DN10334_c0_g1_i3.p1 TRINITY_DN10334_c0_g1~~TRINITY_DN10334_c0_g1_i3.p1  ORF type:complete len:330 (+),score=79.11 TRINITY_DN10334_c0_g1_i3:79-1068(+)